MITSGPLKSSIDKLWEEFWTGGITNPLTVIEQISFLMFARMLDLAEERKERIATRTGKPFKPLFGKDEQHLRWSHFKQKNADEMLKVVRDEVFPFFKKAFSAEQNINGSGEKINVMADAMLLIQKPSLLVSAVNMIDKLPLEEGDTKGNLYEYLLSKLTTAGINGQFRTPRHIIRLMVEMLDPKPDEIIGDPACGTAGFLVEAMLYLQRKYTSPELVFKDDQGTHYPADLLEPHRDHIQTGMFHGFDFDVTMLRIAEMNMMLHGIDRPNIRYQDALSNNFLENRAALASNHFDVILANPPFTGSLDEKDISPTLTGKVKTKKTELLFLALILRMLKNGGRSATIVPDGVLFGSSKAHVALRKMLVEENQLEAVISLPSGVFKPYAGVSTAIVVFTKGGQTNEVFYYDVQADGFSLDDKRTELDQTKHETNNLPDVLERWQHRNAEKVRKRTDQSYLVLKADIVMNNYDLSINRYKEITYKESNYQSPSIILAELNQIEKEIQKEIINLQSLVG
ncbi:MAG: SAM-dependent DNA methyltransferase [Acidobacteriota bacterium]|nr:MAG: SAM-dependent DNA methyltransferase [Acidobacteriota bacterium]